MIERAVYDSLQAILHFTTLYTTLHFFWVAIAVKCMYVPLEYKAIIGPRETGRGG